MSNNPLMYADPTGHWECEDAYSCKHSDTIQSQELAAKHKNDKHPTKPVVTPHTGNDEGIGNYFVAPELPTDPTDDLKPDWAMYFGGYVLTVAGLTMVAGGLIVLGVLFAPQISAGGIPVSPKPGESPGLAILHTLESMGPGGFVLVGGLGLTTAGLSTMKKSEVVQWAYQKVAEPFK